MSQRHFSEQEIIRREKLAKLEAENKYPFLIAKFGRTHQTNELIKEFESFSKEELKEKNVVVKIGGRIRAFREAGKAVFALIQDQYGTIQLYIRQDVVGQDMYKDILDLDLGDIIGVEGSMMKTNTNELTIRVEKLSLLSKALKPLPDKHHGMTDVEERYRRRYVDLIMRPETKDVFLKRANVIKYMREFLDTKGFIEVDTPILQVIHGGANAKPFTTHHNALDMDLYLRIATELHLKRLVVGGFEKIYEIGRIFRNEGMSTRHNPEFTSIELYAAFEDVEYVMNITENVIRYISDKITKKESVMYNDKEIFLGKKFARVHMVDAIKEVTGEDFWKVYKLEDALKIAKKHNVKVDKFNRSVGQIINIFFEEFCEEKIVQPTFIFGHPVEVSPLSKKNEKDARFTDRFELFIDGREYANGFSELNDPIEQYERFEEQLQQKDHGNDEAHEMDIDFVEALEYGLPPTGGVGIGIDRLVMLLTGQDSIKDVILFPHMRPRGK